MAENAVEEKKGRRRKGNPEEEVVAEVENDPSYTPSKGRATPGRRNQEDEKEEGNVVTRNVNGVVSYFQEVRSELEKVSWPTREEVLRLSRVVLITLLVASVFMGAISFLFAQFIAFGLNTPVAFIVVLVVAVLAALYAFRTQNSTSKF